MRSFITISVFASGAFALFNPKICNGSGGCVQNTWATLDPYVCPDGTRLNLQQSASNEIASELGDYEIVTEDKFPTTCSNGSKPSKGDLLVVHTTQFGQKMYSFMHEKCSEKNPKNDCYNANPNPTSSTLCQLIDSKGGICVVNPKAGECESWGGSTIRPQCNGWTPGQPDLPRQN